MTFKENKLEILTLIFLFITFTTIYLLGTVKHEEAHEVIYKTYGCTDVTIEYSYKGGKAICHDAQHFNFDKGMPFQLMNEIMWYNVQLVIIAAFALVTILLTYFAYKEVRR